MHCFTVRQQQQPSKPESASRLMLGSKSLEISKFQSILFNKSSLVSSEESSPRFSRSRYFTRQFMQYFDGLGAHGRVFACLTDSGIPYRPFLSALLASCLFFVICLACPLAG